MPLPLRHSNGEACRSRRPGSGSWTPSWRAVQQEATLERLESDLETLLQAEGLAMRPGPRQPVDAGLLSLLREAILSRRTVEFRYRARSSGQESRQTVEPYGLLYGNRAFLVGRTDWSDEPRLWRLTGVSDARLLDGRFERDPAFDLQRYARRSFGTFQEKPVRVVLRFDADATPDAASFLFHPGQTVQEHEDGTVTVRLRGRRGRRDVLAPGDLGRDGYRREAGAPPAASCQDVRDPCSAS